MSVLPPITSEPPGCSREVGDASEEADIVRILADVSKHTGGTLDVLVNNAGNTSGPGLVSNRRYFGNKPLLCSGHFSLQPFLRDTSLRRFRARPPSPPPVCSPR
jgi:NAD(P)-dependent dehydrogenase (short-subunit alcohol dehydrogenase family)